MFKRISRTRVITAWFLASAMIVAGSIVMGVNITLSTAVLLTTLCLIPPVIMLIVWRGAPPYTVGELLYAVNKPTTGRP
jgi:hypothetical protein